MTDTPTNTALRITSVNEAVDQTADVMAFMTVLGSHYNELLMAVATVYPGETRHETALRYIREREDRTPAAASVEVKE